MRRSGRWLWACWLRSSRTADTCSPRPGDRDALARTLPRQQAIGDQHDLSAVPGAARDDAAPNLAQGHGPKVFVVDLPIEVVFMRLFESTARQGAHLVKVFQQLALRWP